MRVFAFIIGLVILPAMIVGYLLVFHFDKDHEVQDVFIKYTFMTGQKVQVESENFRLIGAMKPEPAQKLVEDMERFRTVLFQYFEIEETTPYPKFEILLIRNPDLFAALLGSEWGGAYYTRNALGNVTVVGPYNMTMDQDKFREVMFHEYVHHFNAFHHDYRVPAWLNEGMAEYFATFKTTGPDSVELGHNIEGNLKELNLKKKGWLELERVAGSIVDYPFARSGGGEGAFRKGHIFYSQSWLLAHWLMNSPEGRTVFEKAGQAMINGEPPLSVFPDDTEEKVKTYAYSDQFQAHEMTVPQIEAAPDVTVTEVEDYVYDRRVLLELAFAAPTELAEQFHQIYLRKLTGIPEAKPHRQVFLVLKYCDSGTRHRSNPIMKLLRRDDLEYQLRRAAIQNLARCIVNESSEELIVELLDQAQESHAEDLDLYMAYLTRRVRYGLDASEIEMFKKILNTEHYQRRPEQSLNLFKLFMAMDDPDGAETLLERVELWDPKGSLSDEIEDFRKDLAVYRRLEAESK